MIKIAKKKRIGKITPNERRKLKKVQGGQSLSLSSWAGKILRSNYISRKDKLKLRNL